MRLVAGIALITRGFTGMLGGAPIPLAALEVLAIASGITLLVGLWTPIAGGAVAVLALWRAFSHPSHAFACLLLATIGIALALLGPGAWSVDARLFGWKRIDVRDRRA